MAESPLQFTSLSSGAWQFLSTNLSEGTVSMHFKCGAISKYRFVRNLPLSLLAKEFWRLVSIWQSWRQKQSGTFSQTRCIFYYWYDCCRTYDVRQTYVIVTHWLRNHQDSSAIFWLRFRSLWIAEPATPDGSVAAKYRNRLDGSVILRLRNRQ